MRESDVEKYFVKVVKSLGGETRKVKWIGRAHAPDRVVMFDPLSYQSIKRIPPATIWAELKRPKGKARIGQLREHVRMRRLGQTVVVLDTIGAIDKWASEL